jgi:hypothetical protein
MLKELITALQPEGKLEEILVEKLMSISWRYRRMLLAEGAEIRRNIEFPEAISHKSTLGIPMGLFYGSDGLIGKVRDPDALKGCLELLMELGEGIEANGFDEEQDKLYLGHIYGDPDEDQSHLRRSLFDDYLTWQRTSKVPEEERARERYATPEQCNLNLLQAIGAEIARLKRDEKKGKWKSFGKGVSDSPGMDRLLRYESSLERAFDPALGADAQGATRASAG